MVGKERFEAPYVAKQRSPDKTGHPTLRDPKSSAHTSALGSSPGLWGSCSNQQPPLTSSGGADLRLMGSKHFTRSLCCKLKSWHALCLVL